MNECLTMSWQPLIIAGIGFVGSIIVAGIGFRAAIKAAKESSSAAIKAAKVTAEANMRQLLQIKAHDATVAAIKVLTNRRNICETLLKLIVDDSSDDRIRLNTRIVFMLSQKLSDMESLDLETLSVLPYIKRGRLPARDGDESSDVEMIIGFGLTCEMINTDLIQRGTNNLTPDELSLLSAGLASIKEPIVRDIDFLEKTLGVLYEELNRIDRACLAD